MGRIRAKREVIRLCANYPNSKLLDCGRAEMRPYHPWYPYQFSKVPLRMLTVLANVKKALPSAHRMREQTTAIGQSPMLAGGSDPETVRDPSERAPGRVTHGRANQERLHSEEVLKDDTGSTALLLGTAVLVAFVGALAIIVVIDVVQYVVAVW